MALMESGDNRPRRNKLTQSVAVKKQQKTEHVTIDVSQEGSSSSLPRITNSPIRIKNKVYTVIDKFHKPIYKKENLLQRDEVEIGGIEESKQERYLKVEGTKSKL